MAEMPYGSTHLSDGGSEADKISDGLFKTLLHKRNTRGLAWGRFFFVANFIGLAVLILLILHVLNSSFGLVVVQNTVDPATLSDRPLEELSEPELAQILADNAPNRVPVVIRDILSVVPQADFTLEPMSVALAGKTFSDEYATLTIGEIPLEGRIQILSDNLSTTEMYDAVVANVVRPSIARAWTFLESTFSRQSVEAEKAERFPNDTLTFKSWISWDFITNSSSSSAATAGLLTALLGSFFIIVITASVALIIGVAAAIYLEEYSTGDNFIENAIEINIRNLAAIPSIIYGMLGLAVFAQIFAVFTGGYLFGANLPPQSEDQIVIDVRQAFGLNGFSGGEREALNLTLNSARTENERITLMIENIAVDALTAEETTRLIRTFFSYRVANLGNVNAFSSPPIDKVKNDIAVAVDISKLSESQLAALEGALTRYGTFNLNGRTVLSAGITLALLILPIIIVNAQEALRAVPSTIREASYGMGATKWQTVSRQVIPAAIPGILTGIILAVSRAIGETAPLLVVGASTFIGVNPNGPFSKFTVVPIQIYQWTSRPEQEFRNLAAAAIIVLLIVMLFTNGTAIFVRNRYSKKF